MDDRQILFIIIFLLYFLVGGMVDTYASHRFFPTKIHPPKWLASGFLFWWLIIYSGLLPFLLIFIASGFNIWVIKIYVTFGTLGSVVWDLIFSKIWSGNWISESCETWFWVGKFKLGFNKKTVLPFHLARVILFLLLFYLFFIR